ncbi:MAG: c-type cytochrome [Nitrospirae bacterium]|nr:c-type cytochrome [Nitrospirota bacterium]
MRKIFVLFCVPAIAVFVLGTLATAKENEKEGQALFQQNCSPCHPNGGNVINPEFTLHKKDRDRHGVKTAKDIIGKMRNPGPGMTKFDEKTISDKQAKEIAEYIIKTFK